MRTSHAVRSLRKKSALTQEELAGLLSLSQTAISRLEGDSETGTLETALGLQVIFDIQPCLLFDRLYATVEDQVMARATKLDRKLRGKDDPASRKKQRLLSEMVRRATTATNGA